MAKADHHFLLFDPRTDIGLGLIRSVVAFLHLKGHFVGTAMFRTTQRADTAGDAAVHIRAGTGDHPRGESRRIELVLGIQVERGVHGADPGFTRLLAMQQMEEMPADGIVVGFHLDALAVVAEVVPVQQRGTQRSHQLVGNVTSARVIVVVLFWRHATQYRHSRAHHIHRMSRRRQLFKRNLQCRRQPAQGLELGLVAGQFGDVGQLAVHQQMGDFLELAAVGKVQHVIAAVVQVVTGAAHGAQGSVAGSSARESHGFLRLEAWGGFRGCAHAYLLKSG